MSYTGPPTGRVQIGNTSDAARRLDDDEKHTLDNIEGIVAAAVGSHGV